MDHLNTVYQFARSQVCQMAWAARPKFWTELEEILSFSLSTGHPLVRNLYRIFAFRYGRILYYLDKAPMMITIAYLRQHQVWPMKLRFFFGFCCPQGKKMWWGCCPQWVDIFQKFHSHFGSYEIWAIQNYTADSNEEIISVRWLRTR